jgi:hypothetical protein
VRPQVVTVNLPRSGHSDDRAVLPRSSSHHVRLHVPCRPSKYVRPSYVQRAEAASDPARGSVRPSYVTHVSQPHEEHNDDAAHFFFCRHRRQWHRELEIDRSSMYVDDISKLLLRAAVCYKASVWTWRCTGKCKSITRTMNLSVHLHARNEHILHRVGRCLYVLYCQRACLLVGSYRTDRTR